MVQRRSLKNIIKKHIFGMGSKWTNFQMISDDKIPDQKKMSDNMPERMSEDVPD